MPMTKTGGHFRITNEDTVDLVRRLAEHYDDQHHRGDPGQAETPHRHRPAVHPSPGGDPARRPRHPRLPAADTDVGPDGDDAVVVTITAAEQILGVGKVTLYRWLRDGFITGEQITPGAPWRIRIDQALRDRIRTRGPRRLARPRRGRRGPRSRPTDRVAQGPTRRTASRPRQPRTPQRPAYPGQTRPGWTVRHTR